MRELTDTHPIVLVNSVNEFRIEGQKTAAFEIHEDLDGGLDALCIPVGNAGNITSYWRGFREMGAAPRLFGFQAEGAAPLVEGKVIEHPETVASAIRIGNPVRWEDAMAAATDSRGAIRAVSDEEILAAYRLLASQGRHVLRAGLGGVGRGPAQVRRRRRRADRLRAHRPRPEGPRDGDRATTTAW